MQAATGVAVGMHIYMFKAHAALGEGLQAVALMKDMRAVGLPVPAPACSLLVLAFCKADALQVQHNKSEPRLLTLCKIIETFRAYTGLLFGDVISSSAVLWQRSEICVLFVTYA